MIRLYTRATSSFRGGFRQNGRRCDPQAAPCRIELLKLAGPKMPLVAIDSYRRNSVLLNQQAQASAGYFLVMIAATSSRCMRIVFSAALPAIGRITSHSLVSISISPRNLPAITKERRSRPLRITTSTTTGRPPYDGAKPGYTCDGGHRGHTFVLLAIISSTPCRDIFHSGVTPSGSHRGHTFDFRGTGILWT